MPGVRPLPDNPNLEWLRKQAKHHLDEVRKANPDAQLADAQFDLAKEYGFSSWRALKSHVDAQTIDGRLFAAAKDGDVGALAALLDQHPEKLTVRNQPYEWTLLHVAAHNGRLGAVDLLLQRGLDVNSRERGDETYAMHWAAAAGHVDVVRRLIDAGGDVIGRGDDHALEVIGWATCWDGCDDDAHRAVVDLLLAHGARHHIFSAIAMNLAGDVRRIVTADPGALHTRMSRNENERLPLHFAVIKDRQEMISLLLELGADPLGVDGSGFPVAAYVESAGGDRAVMEAIRKMTAAELTSAVRGRRPPRVGMMDLLALLALGDRETADRLMREVPDLLAAGGAAHGALHLLSKRGDAGAVRWLLDRGADPNAKWAHWDSDVTPLHLAILADHAEIVRLLLAAGAEPRIRDSKHDSDAEGWAEFFERREIVGLLRGSSPEA